jgi:hypothetical protein
MLAQSFPGTNQLLGKARRQRGRGREGCHRIAAECRATGASEAACQDVFSTKQGQCYKIWHSFFHAVLLIVMLLSTHLRKATGDRRCVESRSRARFLELPSDPCLLEPPDLCWRGVWGQQRLQRAAAEIPKGERAAGLGWAPTGAWGRRTGGFHCVAAPRNRGLGGCRTRARLLLLLGL